MGLMTVIPRGMETVSVLSYLLQKTDGRGKRYIGFSFPSIFAATKNALTLCQKREKCVSVLHRSLSADFVDRCPLLEVVCFHSFLF